MRDELIRELDWFLANWDPMGLITWYGAPRNEYLGEATRIADAVLSSDYDGALASVVKDILDRRFGVPTSIDEIRKRTIELESTVTRILGG